MVEPKMIEMLLGRIVIHERSDRQFIFLVEKSGKRHFPIVIGSNEAAEIQRVISGVEFERPMTHQLAYSMVQALGADLVRCDIVDLKQNTFFAQLCLRSRKDGAEHLIDARPSDGI